MKDTQAGALMKRLRTPRTSSSEVLRKVPVAPAYSVEQLRQGHTFIVGGTPVVPLRSYLSQPQHSHQGTKTHLSGRPAA
jgi:hypothetical protein